ncbi:Fc receptor-like protein 4 isoform X1 [Haplochromis burtoni]|uniref:Fc receptor-like protein 4 isoform X1 n=1 Tax=Haplochromis burtoni TaxID=8153 RepID=UPI001C2DE88D|nr:Fc receptor-like protein 4 isoform X1 [Haplochromis burtoni]
MWVESFTTLNQIFKFPFSVFYEFIMDNAFPLFPLTAGKPRATLTPGSTIIPVGGSVTLTCSVGSSAGWKYEWFRRDPNTEVQMRTDDQQNGVIRVSQGGIYHCRGRRGNPVYYTDKSDDVTIEITFSNKVVVKGRPSWPQIFSGETISLTCEVQEGGETTEWEYRWRGANQTTQWTHNNYWIFRVSESSSGDYRCKSRRRDDSYSSTEWSEAFNLSASTGKPRATLTPGSTIIPVGGSVTLTCSVGSSAGWKYEWFRRDPNTEVQMRTDDQQNGVIRVSQGGIYHCRGRRGNPVYYTDKSDDVTIEITFSNKVVVKGRPSWPQIFSGETISLTCEVQEGGETTEWEYRWRGANQTTQWTHNNYWIFRVSESSSGDYTCKSRRRDDSYSSTEWSEAFNLSASNAVLTVEPSSTMFIGETVSFKCDMKEGKHTGWEYKLMKDGRAFIPYNRYKNYRKQMKSTSDTGKYQCSGHMKKSHYTKNSNTVSLTVLAGKPRATLTPGSTIIPVGGSVTLTCSVGSSAGWKYEWFRRDPNTDVQIRTDDQQNGVIRVSQGGIYCCRGRRGNPVYYTDKSDDVTIEITFSNKVVVKGRRSWPQIFSGETISLTCEVQEGGETTE